MKIACSTTAFSRLPLAEALTQISKLGFRYVDLLAMQNWAHIYPGDLVRNFSSIANEVSTLLKEINLEAVALNCSTSFSMSTGDRCEVDIIVEEAAALIRLAEWLDVPVVVFQPGGLMDGLNFDQAISNSLRVLKKIVSGSTNIGVTIAIETHVGSLAEEYKDALRFNSEIPELKLAYDPSHFIMSGFDLSGSETLLQHAAHIHLRNAVKGNFQAPMEDGDLDFMWVLDAIDRSGYAAAVSIEYIDKRDREIMSDIELLKKKLESRYNLTERK
jgi:sugar phosphate isomerase/epimerase